jgi:hypothetical protein
MLKRRNYLSVAAVLGVLVSIGMLMPPPGQAENPSQVAIVSSVPLPTTVPNTELIFDQTHVGGGDVFTLDVARFKELRVLAFPHGPQALEIVIGPIINDGGTLRTILDGTSSIFGCTTTGNPNGCTRLYDAIAGKFELGIKGPGHVSVYGRSN